MTCVTEEQRSRQTPAESGKPWTRGRRLMVSVPIFIVLMGLLVAVSSATAVPWNIEPTGQTMATLAADTAVTFDESNGVKLPVKGEFKVRERHVVAVVSRNGDLVSIQDESASDGTTEGSTNASPSLTDEGQRIRIAIREPIDATGARPAVVFMHGAGYGGADNSFGDIAYDLASAGFVTAVPDKPVWNTTDLNRDYPASARAYEQVIAYLRGLDHVNPDRIGIYATSESTWVSSYLLDDDPNIAFQILLSPMVFSPRQALGFFISQDFTLVGAHDGYQSIVRRVFNIDAGLFSLTNLDIDTLNPEAYSIPTFVAYGSKDVMTAQVDGARRILAEAHRAGNWDITFRSYPVANHVLRLGNEAEQNTPLADRYTNDLIAWASGTVLGLTQTSERMAGEELYQSIGLPSDLKPRRTLTVYGVILHGSMLVLILVCIVMAVVTLCRVIAARRRWKKRGRCGPKPVVLGFSHGFGNALLTLTITTVAALDLFVAGLGQVVFGVVNLAWGGAPTETPGVMQWSWPVIQVVSVLVVWAWSRVFARLVEVASRRGLIQLPPRKGAVKEIVTGAEPVLAFTRFGRVLFWLVAITMLYVLLFFAFWGLFVY